MFVCVLVPIYWVEQGPANFLWLSDIALLAIVPALWMENRFLTSMVAVGVLLPELAWNLDFFLRLIAGFDVIGLNGTGYMFGSSYTPLFKFFSLFHVILPVLLLWMIYRLGYDTRAVYAQTLLIWILLPVCYLATDPDRNLNWVFGIGNPPQTWVSGPLYLVLLMCAYPLLVLIPTHFILKSVFNGR
ncbi:MAG: membrane-associated protein [Gammaproteobacteria bacterium]|nr:membrane-associated protein [Gammaproteobacteria bacterium]